MAALARIRVRFPRVFLRSFPLSLVTDAGANAMPGNDPEVYREAMSQKTEILKRRMIDPNRFQCISEREERSLTSLEAVRSSTEGKYLGFYRGIDLLKGPEDLFILYQMFWHVTVIELGSFTGASALWMADALKGSNIECNVFSVNIDLSLLHPLIKSLQPPNLSFFEGDCNEIEEVFPTRFLNEQPHPIIVIDDVHENSENIMEYFHKHLIPGDYIICEDTNPNLPNQMTGGHWGFDKLHAFSKFLSKHGDVYAIDSFFTNFFGYNASSNWNGYARRMK